MTKGYAAIGLCRPKHPSNIGGALRAATVYGAAFIAVQGDRTPIDSRGDTTKAYRNIPLLRSDDLFSLIPYDAVPIAIEIVAEARPLPSFCHPPRAFYIFGPEDGSIKKEHIQRCKFVVSIPTIQCMNLAATVNVVLYDRLCKSWK